MMSSLKPLAGLLLALSFAGAVHAAEPPADPNQRTAWGLYFDAREAYAQKTGPEGGKTLFVDVRDPVEIMFTGFTDVVDVNIPFMTADRTRWNDARGFYGMNVNPDFEPQIAKALAERGLDKNALVILMCRSGGERGAPSARMLEEKGYSKVYVVVDGFEGTTVKDGERKNWRLVNGWKNAGLPWSYKLNKAKMPLQ